MKLLLLTIIICIAGTCASQTYHNGDIVFIQLGAKNKSNPLPEDKNGFDCSGIIFMENDQPFVYYAREPFSKIPLKDFIALSEDRSVQVRHLSDKALLTGAAIHLMHEYAIVELGSAYDNALKLNNDALYNAEFVWQAYQLGTGLSLCIPRALRDYGAKNKAGLDLLKEAYGNSILDEKIVTVSDLYRSQFLE